MRLKFHSADVNLLKESLKAIVDSNDYTLISQNPHHFNILEYGFSHLTKQQIVFDCVKEDNFWYFVCQGIFDFYPDTKIFWTTMRNDLEIYKTLILELNERVKLIIKNKYHQHDELFANIWYSLNNEISHLSRTYKPLN